MRPAGERAMEDRSPGERVVVALDGLDAGGALALVDALGDEARLYKVGPGLFLDAGPAIISSLRQRGKLVFLDLKLHDIPNSVAAAVARAASLGVSLLTLHASGGREMLRAARKAAPEGRGLRLLAVTLLTSLDSALAAEVFGETGRDPEALALRLGRLAREEAIDGLVCSPREVKGLRAALGPACLLVTPGIRSAPPDAAGGGDDQKRTRGAAAALRSGADLLVVGRPILDAPSPREAFLALRAEVASVADGGGRA